MKWTAHVLVLLLLLLPAAVIVSGSDIQNLQQPII